MARQARQRGDSGIYHVMLRGINQTQLFYDVEDRQFFLERLSRLRSDGSFKLRAYALMGNHAHLLLEERTEKLSVTVKRLTVGYSRWFNNKYDRTGYLFQGRFRSEPVDDDAYLLTVVKYIHLNPVRAGEKINSWTSYDGYLQASELVDTDLVLSLFAPDDSTARARFQEFLQAPSPTTDTVLGTGEPNRLSDAQAIKLITSLEQVDTCTQLLELDKPTRDEAIIHLKDAGLTIRQISRLTGINRGIVSELIRVIHIHEGGDIDVEFSFSDQNRETG